MRSKADAKDPELIRRVNAAAGLHPWLSTIIHKAARNNASKEELAKLGRVVARLGRGEGVGEGEGPTPPKLQQPKAQAPKAQHPKSQPPKPEQSNERPKSEQANAEQPDAAEESDNEDIDMTGPKQVGGGSLPPSIDSNDSAATAVEPTVAASAPIPSVLAPVDGASTSYKIPSTFTQPPPATSQPQPTFSAVPSRPPAVHAPPQPAPPRRIYPLPPPFLLVAFKETPTEKYLLPLGSQSYVSRVGEERPKVPPRKTTPQTASAEASSTAPPPSSADQPRGRTRASLGRGAKEAVEAKAAPAPSPAPEEVAKTPVEEPVEVRSKPLDPPIPGACPEKGTVLLSTIVPLGEWQKPDWPNFEKRMPFYSREYDEKLPQVGQAIDTVSNTPASKTSPTVSKTGPTSPLQRPRHGPAPYTGPKLDTKRLLNLAAESFMPEEGSVQAVTIRIEGLHQSAWQRMRWVLDHVEGMEMKALSAVRPDLLESLPPPPAPTPGVPYVPKPFDPNLHPRLRSAYADLRKSYFEHLLQRKTQRSFPRLRIAVPRADIKDAMTDK